jgi:hypothetical protein
MVLFAGTLACQGVTFMTAFLALWALGASLGGFDRSQNPEAAVIGSWEGESKCTVPDSPCHDEHVIFIIATDNEAGGLKLDGYKVVDGKKQFMGTLECKYKAARNNLSCVGGNPQKKADWQFVLSGASMQGSLFVGEERTLYRKITLQRTSQ